jgi:cytochrome P450
VFEEPRLIPPLIEEVLRYEPPAQSSLRIVTEDAEIGGVRVPRGAVLAVLLGSALRDENVFPEAERFRLEREGPSHLPFGHGVHFCLGAMLARLEARLGLEALVSRVRGVHLTQREVRWSQSFIARGPLALPVHFPTRTG